MEMKGLEEEVQQLLEEQERSTIEAQGSNQFEKQYSSQANEQCCDYVEKQGCSQAEEQNVEGQKQSSGIAANPVAKPASSMPASPVPKRKISFKLAYGLAGAGLIAAGALFSALNAGKVYDKAVQLMKEQPREQVLLAETELAKKPHSSMLIENIIRVAEKDQRAEKDYAQDYSTNKSAPENENALASAKTLDDFTRPKPNAIIEPRTEPRAGPRTEPRAGPRTEPRTSTPKVLEMMLEQEMKGKPEYVFVVDKGTQKAKVYKLTYELVDEADVSTGRNPGDKERSGDNKTPNGVFEVQSIQDSSNWRYDGELAYGPKAARLKTGAWDAKGNYYPDKNSDILAHGTNEPDKLGSAASHGCVRFLNDRVQEYVDKGYLKKGTLFAIVENHDYVPTRIKAGPLAAVTYATTPYAAVPLAADNEAKPAHLPTQVYSLNQEMPILDLQDAKKPISQGYEKYNVAGKNISVVTESKSSEAKATEAKIAETKSSEAKKAVDAKGEIK